MINNVNQQATDDSAMNNTQPQDGLLMPRDRRKKIMDKLALADASRSRLTIADINTLVNSIERL